MSPDDLARLCLMPRLLRGGTESARVFLREISIKPDEVTIEGVRAVLDADSRLVEEWQHWSEDKRTRSGWFLSCENGSYVVGHLPDGYRDIFSDALSACADFVTKEIRDILRTSGGAGDHEHTSSR